MGWQPSPFGIDKKKKRRIIPYINPELNGNPLHSTEGGGTIIPPALNSKLTYKDSSKFLYKDGSKIIYKA